MKKVLIFAPMLALGACADPLGTTLVSVPCVISIVQAVAPAANGSGSNFSKGVASAQAASTQLGTSACTAAEAAIIKSVTPATAAPAAIMAPVVPAAGK